MVGCSIVAFTSMNRLLQLLIEFDVYKMNEDTPNQNQYRFLEGYSSVVGMHLTQDRISKGNASSCVYVVMFCFICFGDCLVVLLMSMYVLLFDQYGNI